MRLSRLIIAFKAIHQLGLPLVMLNAIYKIGLASGHYRRAIRPPNAIPSLRLKPLVPAPLPEELRRTLGEAGLRSLLAEAEEIASGNFRQFGVELVPLRLAPESPLKHWTAYESGQANRSDIKLLWEPARFGWAFVLGRAYLASADERFAGAFWEMFETFNTTNPPYLGENWTSGQEVGLRLMAWVWAGQIFLRSEDSNPARLAALANAVASHAARIPATLVYACSQNNNHLLTEAAALYTAGLALPDHPLAASWRELGRKWLGWCFDHQIDRSGEYVQHSMNYHRLMLQTALWGHAIARHDPSQKTGAPFGEAGLKNLVLAANWLLSRLDPVSGQVPNLGANDGALIFPLSNGDFVDYRPIAQAASRAFLGTWLPSGAWDEMSLWYGLAEAGKKPAEGFGSEGQLSAINSWASLRAVRYTSRPSHADQLHCDLWWRGWNVARDAGTYRYTASPPWDNQLTTALVHNTVSINGVDQMTRAGRFLYLDWAQADFLSVPASGAGAIRSISARTDAYARFNVRHERSVAVVAEDRWLIEDNLLHPAGDPAQAIVYRLHWLLPDWEWRLEKTSAGARLLIRSPRGWVKLVVGSNQPVRRLGLIRAGEPVFGEGLLSVTYGWYSPTYNVKMPALSFAVEVQSTHDVRLTSEFIFPAQV
jgi:hypothetical protein